MSQRELPLPGVHDLREPGPLVLPCSALVRRPRVLARPWHTLIALAPPQRAGVIGGRSQRAGRGITRQPAAR